jgi:hypothetical protein
MLYRFLADAVMMTHAILLIFFVIGGFLVWRWPRLIWAHLFVGFWNLAIVILDFGCPVTAVEKELRRRAGEQPYDGGFIKHYVDGTVYPEGYTWLAERIGFALVLISYLLLLWWHFSRRVPPADHSRRTSKV